MSPSTRLLEMARAVANVHAARPGVRAILVAGSVARGDADDSSDIDMSIVYDLMPSAEEIDEVRRSLGGSDRVMSIGDPKDGGYVESFYLEGVRRDFGHVTIAELEKDMAEVLVEHKADSPIQKVLSGILDSIPLYGHELIERWKSMAADYPEPLAESMVRAHARFRPTWVARRYGSDRSDLLFYHELLVEAEKNILGTMVGLNRIYHWGEYKRMDNFIAGLTIAPPELSRRLKLVLRAEPDQALETLDRLIEETFALVEQHMPGVDISEAVRKYRREFGG